MAAGGGMMSIAPGLSVLSVTMAVGAVVGSGRGVKCTVGLYICFSWEIP